MRESMQVTMARLRRATPDRKDLVLDGGVASVGLEQVGKDVVHGVDRSRPRSVGANPCQHRRHDGVRLRVHHRRGSGRHRPHRSSHPGHRCLGGTGAGDHPRAGRPRCRGDHGRARSHQGGRGDGGGARRRPRRRGRRPTARPGRPVEHPDLRPRLRGRPPAPRCPHRQRRRDGLPAGHHRRRLRDPVRHEPPRPLPADPAAHALAGGDGARTRRAAVLIGAPLQRRRPRRSRLRAPALRRLAGLRPLEDGQRAVRGGPRRAAAGTRACEPSPCTPVASPPSSAAT